MKTLLCKILYPAIHFIDEPVVFDFPIGNFREEQDGAQDILNFIFRECNHVDGNEWIASQKLRSMSQNDLIILAYPTGKVEVWMIAAIGFTQIY